MFALAIFGDRPITTRRLQAVMGTGAPYPVDPTETVPVTKRAASRVREIQRAAQIAVDGELGPQTWVVHTFPVPRA